MKIGGKGIIFFAVLLGVPAFFALMLVASRMAFDRWGPWAGLAVTAGIVAVFIALTRIASSGRADADASLPRPTVEWRDIPAYGAVFLLVGIPGVILGVAAYLLSRHIAG